MRLNLHAESAGANMTNLSIGCAHLSFGRHHLCNLQVLLELALGDPLERLVEMWLDSTRFFRLRKNLQELIIGEEEKPRKVQTLHLQVIAQPLDDFVQL